MKIPADVVISVLGSTVVLSGLFLYLLFNLDKLERSAAILLRFFAFIIPARKVRNRYVATNIQSQINKYAEEIEKKAPGVMPAALRIRFAGDNEIHAFESKDGETILLRMSYDYDSNRMLAAASFLYIQKGFLNRAKFYIGDPIRHSIDLCVTKGLLRRTAAISHFIDSYLQPAINDAPALQEICRKIDFIDEDGFFYEVFVRVMLRTSSLLFPKVTDDAIKIEIALFLDFLYRVASKKQGEKVPLAFNGHHISVSIILLKEDEVYREHGAGAYVNRYILSMQDGIQIIFLKGIDEEAIDLVRAVTTALRRRNLFEYEKEIIRPLRTGSKGYKRAIYAYTLPNRGAAEFQQTKNEEDLIKLLYTHVPPIASGDVEILSTARAKGILSKVLVKSKDPSRDPARECMGDGNIYIQELWNALDKESIEFIRYQENMGALIREAVFKRFNQSLYCNATNVDGINRYDVSLSKDEAFTYALGNGALHKRLADRLLGIRTYFESPSVNDPVNEELG